MKKQHGKTIGVSLLGIGERHPIGKLNELESKCQVYLLRSYMRSSSAASSDGNRVRSDQLTDLRDGVGPVPA